MQVSQVDLKALGIDPLRGRAKEGTGWPENNRDEKWDWKYYCVTCKLEVKKPYLCKAERHLNKTVYSPQNPNWSFNRPPSLRPRCPQCRELDKLVTKQQRIDWFKSNIAKIYEEEQRLKSFQKKWKKYRKKNYDLLFNNSNLKIPRESLRYKDQDMWQCHLNLLEYIEDHEGQFMPRSDSTKEDLKIVWELDHKYRSTRKQNEQANLMRNSGDHELEQKNYPRALDYYNRAIMARIDRTDLYLARSELYFITGQYDKCITDCSIIISMIDVVHLKQKESGIYVNAYYNRAKAKKFLSRLEEAKSDLESALLVDEEDMECKKLLSEINTLLLLNKKEEKDEEKDEDRLLFDGGIEFLKTAEDKTSDSEYKLFSCLFGLIQNNKVYYDKFVCECHGMDLCLNYMRSKFKGSKTKSALKDLGKPGLGILLNMVNVMIEKESIVNDDEWIIKNVKLISNNILYIFTLYFYLDKVLQKECLKFAATMVHIKRVKRCISISYAKPLMERFRKINIKMGKKKIKTAVLDGLMLQCMLLFDVEYDYKTNNKIAGMYNMNEVLYEWMMRYIAHCERLKHGDKEYDICFKNLCMILDGVHDTIHYLADSAFYILYDDRKKKEFGSLMQYLNKLKRNIDMEQCKITVIIKGFKILNGLSNKEYGRKYMLQNNGLFENMSNILRLIQSIDDKELSGFVDNIFKALIQQHQDNEEQKEIEEKEEKERKEREEKERKQKEEEERLEKMRKEKEEKEKELKEREQQNKAEPMDGDLDGLSDDSDEEYLKSFEEEEENRKKKEKREQRKKKKKKKKKDDSSVIKTFVSKKEPAKFDEKTMQNVFGDKLSMNEIKAILSINTSDK